MPMNTDHLYAAGYHLPTTATVVLMHVLRKYLASAEDAAKICQNLFTRELSDLAWLDVHQIEQEIELGVYK